MNLIRQLSTVNPRWREEISSNPLEAAVELGLLEPEDIDPEIPQELDFHTYEDRTEEWYYD